MKHIRIQLLIVGSLLLLASVASADIAPPDDYVETCTLEAQQVDGTECQVCGVSFEDPEACTTQYAGTDYAEICNTWGGSFYDEIWCRNTGDVSAEDIAAERARRVAALEAGEDPDNPSEEDDGERTRDGGGLCSSTPQRGWPLGALVLAAAMLVTRRR